MGDISTNLLPERSRLESCELKSGQNCPQETRLTMLESKVKSLESGQNREEEFRRTYYEDREARIKRDAELDGKLSAIGEDLGEVKTWVTEQQRKPGKRLDGLIEKTVSLLVAAIVGFLLARIGL